MSKGAGYAPEFRAKAVGLLAEARGSCSSEARAVEQAARDPGGAPETLRRWRDKVDARSRRRPGSRPGRDGRVEGSRAEAARLRRANGILTTVTAFFAARLGPARRWWSLASTGSGTVLGSGRSAGRRPLRRAVDSSRRAAAACPDPGPSAAWPPGARRRPAASSGSMPVSSWPCTGAARRAPGRRRRVGIRPGSAAAGRAPPPWTPGSCRCRRWNRRYHGPPRMAARTVSCTMPIMACGTSAPSAPPG